MKKNFSKKNFPDFSQKFIIFEKSADFKCSYNYEFLIFFIHLRCKNDLQHSKNSIPPLKNSCALEHWENRDFHRFFDVFGLNLQYILARSARGSARAPEISCSVDSPCKIDAIFTKNECKICKTRWKTLKVKGVPKIAVLGTPLTTLTISQTGKISP